MRSADIRIGDEYAYQRYRGGVVRMVEVVAVGDDGLDGIPSDANVRTYDRNGKVVIRYEGYERSGPATLFTRVSARYITEVAA